MKREINTFLAALMFYTRIPVSRKMNPEHFNESGRYFTLVGTIIGTFGAGVYYLSLFVFPHLIAVLLSMASTVLLTGAMHEDGLADTFDGLGGGSDKESMLKIMKDSGIGVYGVLGLIFVLGLKAIALFNMNIQKLPLIIFCGHTISRFAASTLLYTHEYVSDSKTSKSQQVTKRMSFLSLMISAIFGIVPLAIFCEPYVFLVIIPLLIFQIGVGKWFKPRIGGYTGDCAGANQQLTELLFYLSMIVLWQFI
ncbi:MAG: adenosylcobinamide-GDP ribazoletransferase [Flavobacteriales bacterium]